MLGNPERHTEYSRKPDQKNYNAYIHACVEVENAIRMYEDVTKNTLAKGMSGNCTAQRVVDAMIVYGFASEAVKNDREKYMNYPVDKYVTKPNPEELYDGTMSDWTDQ